MYSTIVEIESELHRKLNIIGDQTKTLILLGSEAATSLNRSYVVLLSIHSVSSHKSLPCSISCMLLVLFIILILMQPSLKS